MLIFCISAYTGKYIYENSQLKQVSHAEGYFEPKAGGGYQYVYYLKDHLNNVRITFADDNGDGVVGASEIRREQNYYPFGLEHKGYNGGTYGVKNNLKTFQDQEFTEELGLNVHEWKYRISDPTIGRFWQVDPLAEDYRYQTVYQFSSNQPIHAPELEGLESQADLNVDLMVEGYASGEYTKEEVFEVWEAKAEGVAAGLSLILPGPEDIAIGGFLATKVGGAIVKGLTKIISKGGDNVVKTTEKVVDNAATKNRVKLRKGTKETIKENAPKTDKGDFIDPNTGKVIPKEGPYDIGHKPGQEWRTRKKMHEEKGSTRKEVIEAENNPDLYQIENPSSNRSHRYEKKDNQ